MNYFEYLPNLYLLMVGPAGSKKTTAMKVAYNILKDLGDIPLAVDCTSKEQLVVELEAQQRVARAPNGEVIEYSPMTICAEEFSQFLARDPLGILDFLTTIWDKHVYDDAFKTAGAHYIPGPCVTILSCTIPDWITEWLRATVIKGGFGRRCLFLYEGHSGERITFPTITKEMEEARTRCLEYGRQLKQVTGPMAWTDEARTRLDAWYQTYDIPTDSALASYYSTKQCQVCKLATILSLAEDFERKIKAKHIIDALSYLELLETTLPFIYRISSKNIVFAQGSKVLELLSHVPGCELAEVEIKEVMAGEVEELEDVSKILRFLVSTGQLVLYEKTVGEKKIPFIKLVTERSKI